MITLRKQLYSPASLFKPASNESFPLELLQLLPTSSLIDVPESDVGDTFIDSETASPWEAPGKEKITQKFKCWNLSLKTFNKQDPKMSYLQK